MTRRPPPAAPRPPLPAALAFATLLLATACRPATPPPSAEFLVSAGDSTYWVRTDTTGIRVRGSPILLARLSGRFHEIYVTDDDQSFTDATFVGQRIYRRDLVTGDSTLVFQDTLIPSMARSHERANPRARRLLPDEDAPEEPGTSTTAEVTVLDVHGPYLSYDYHVDVERLRGPSWHSTRRGVLDLRNGGPATLSALFGDAIATRVAREAHRSYLAAIDSIFRTDSQSARLVAAALRYYAFDASSFALTDVAGAAAVAFHVPGRGSGTAGGTTIAIPPIAAGDPGWWEDVRGGLPVVTADSVVQRWPRGALELAARYDTTRGSAYATLALRDSIRRREWRIARVQAPIYHVHWLDRPALDSLARQGLARAFNDAALYDENVRTASMEKGGSRKEQAGAVSVTLSSRGMGAPGLSSRTRAAPAAINSPCGVAAHAPAHPGSRNSLRSCGMRGTAPISRARS